MFGVNLNSKIMSCKLICEKCSQKIDLEKVFLDDTKYGMVGISDSMMIYRYVICNHCSKINLLSEFQASITDPEYDFIGGKWLSEK